MKTFALIILITSYAFAATYQGKNIDGKKLAASTRVNGVVESVFVRFDGRGVELWLKGEILPMKLADEIIHDLNAVTVYDGKREFTLKLEMGN